MRRIPVIHLLGAGSGISVVFAGLTAAGVTPPSRFSATLLLLTNAMLFAALAVIMLVLGIVAGKAGLAGPRE